MKTKFYLLAFLALLFGTRMSAQNVCFNLWHVNCPGGTMCVTPFSGGPGCCYTISAGSPVKICLDGSGTGSGCAPITLTDMHNTAYDITFTSGCNNTITDTWLIYWDNGSFDIILDQNFTNSVWPVSGIPIIGLWVETDGQGDFWGQSPGCIDCTGGDYPDYW